MDPRISQLASNLVSYSMRVKKGDRVLIEATGPTTFPMAEALIDEVYAVGGIPHYGLEHEPVKRALLRGATDDQYALEGAWQLSRMMAMDCYVAVRGNPNVTELSDVPEERMKLWTQHIMQGVHHRQRVPHTKWVVLRWPSPSFAQAARMSTSAFEDLYFRACLVDYGKLSRAMNPLKRLMEQTDKVHIKSPGTDLKFSIAGVPIIKCDGEHNIPDGEVYTAPVRDSVNGTIAYNTTTLFDGTMFDGIQFTFKKGRIIKAIAGTKATTTRLNEILDRDEGARYVGEFALGVNPLVKQPTLDTLFDEKIAGSIHFTPGNAYEDADNGNRSQNHWDIVLRQLEENGGGEIWFDGKLIRKNGLFLPPKLKALNPR